MLKKEQSVDVGKIIDKRSWNKQNINESNCRVKWIKAIN